MKFVECFDFPTSEEVSNELLISQDYSLNAVRRVLQAISQEESSSSDRRGIVDGRQIFGAYCHGGLRGATNLTKRKPITIRFLNRFLQLRLRSQSDGTPVSWSALMLMQASNVEVHRDWRNEWGTVNYTMHVPGEVQLWVDSQDSRVKGSGPPSPTWDTAETQILTDAPVSFDPRRHHAVRMQPNWFL